MPIAALLWFIGWALSCTGSKRETSSPKPKLQVNNELSVFVASPELKYAA